MSRGRYPDIWDRYGYPDTPHPAALLGDVIHRALEVIVDALGASGCTTTDSSEAVGVLRGLGGLSAVPRESIEIKIDDLGNNPRIAAEVLENLRQALTDQLGMAANRVQLFLSRGTLPAWAVEGNDDGAEGESPAGGHGGQRRRTPIGVGAHPEVDVVADELRLWGGIDLLTVDAGSTKNATNMSRFSPGIMCA